MSYSNGLGNLQQLLGNLATNNASLNATQNQKAVADDTKAAKASSADATKLSTASGLVSASANESDVRLDKVTALQQSIANGTYNVSAGDVASSIITSLLG